MVKEGYWYGLPLVIVAGGLFFLGVYAPAVLFLVLAVLVLNFFRDPDRPIPSEPGVIVSPADGRVVEVTTESFEGRPLSRLSIFMSPLDVHVNRSPVEGTLGAVVYKKGKFRVASKREASEENEQNIFTIESGHGLVVVKQIAGMVARRIVFWKRPGDRMARGERVGLIKFGSRVDVLVDPAVVLRVKVGDRVRAGSTVLGVSSVPAESRGPAPVVP